MRVSMKFLIRINGALTTRCLKPFKIHESRYLPIRYFSESQPVQTTSEIFLRLQRGRIPTNGGRHARPAVGLPTPADDQLLELALGHDRLKRGHHRNSVRRSRDPSQRQGRKYVGRRVDAEVVMIKLPELAHHLSGQREITLRMAHSTWGGIRKCWHLLHSGSIPQKLATDPIRIPDGSFVGSFRYGCGWRRRSKWELSCRVLYAWMICTTQGGNKDSVIKFRSRRVNCVLSS